MPKEPGEQNLGNEPVDNLPAENPPADIPIPEKKEIVLTSEQQEYADRLLENGGKRLFANDYYSGYLPSDFFSSPEVQKLAEKKLSDEFGAYERHRGGFDWRPVKRIKEQFSLSDEIIHEAAINGIAKMLSKHDYNNTDDLADKLHLSKGELQRAAKLAFPCLLQSGDLDSAIYIRKKFSLPDDIFSSQEVQQAVRAIIVKAPKNYWLSTVAIIRKEFSLPDGIFSSQEVQQAATDTFFSYIRDGNIAGASEIRRDFGLPDDEVQRSIIDGFSDYLADEKRNPRATGTERLEEINDKFNLSDSVIKEAVIEGCIKSLGRGDMDTALEIKDEFSLDVSEILKEFPEIERVVDEVDKISPGFRGQVEKSMDVLSSLFQSRGNPDLLLHVIEDNPFLAGAISENPQMGARLLVKFPEFDQESKENIEFLFQAKKEITEQHPDIDPDSPEFRQLMQEKLMGYKNNQEIYDCAVADGVKMDQWLSYDKEDDFSLGAEKPVPFTEMVKTPISRMQETLQAYQAQFKATLGQFRGELSAYKIPGEDIEGLKAQEANMVQEMEKAKAEGNERKAKGIERGLVPLRAKIENPKMIGLWDKIVGDFDAVVALQKDLLKLNNLIAQKEQEELSIGGDTKSAAKDRRKALQKVKAGKGKLQYEFGEKFETMNRRLEDFRGALPKIIGPCLKEDRTASLLQEIQEQTGENFNHYETDRATLKNILEDDDKKEKLDGRQMTVGLWGRNPDTDLYLGNYTACCICIDSEYHGTESPISDYATDIGMQVITIIDQKTEKPVVAAWCYIGKDAKGKTALVIDNIEADTKYSVPYKIQLEARMKGYVGEYAKSCNLHVEQGPNNNDLKVARYSERYAKLGGYNRPNGYFLEAEPDEEDEFGDEED